MFYDSMGALLAQAARSLASDDPARALDEREKRERRQITTLVRRVGAIWPALFRTLSEESAILAATLERVGDAARAQGCAAPSGTRAASVDPLERYRELLRELDALAIGLHERGEEPWARDALGVLRRGLAEASEVQGRLVDEMLAA